MCLTFSVYSPMHDFIITMAINLIKCMVFICHHYIMQCLHFLMIFFWFSTNIISILLYCSTFSYQWFDLPLSFAVFFSQIIESFIVFSNLFGHRFFTHGIHIFLSIQSWISSIATIWLALSWLIVIPDVGLLLIIRPITNCPVCSLGFATNSFSSW